MDEHNWLPNGDDEQCGNDCGLVRRPRVSTKGKAYWVYTYSGVVLSFRSAYTPPTCEAMKSIYDEDRGYNVVPAT